MRRLAIGATGAALLLIGAGSASAEFLSGEEIKSVIGGKRVYLATGYGIEFPMQYTRNGRVTGDGTGTGLGKYFAPKETGNWWIAGNQMCQRFPTWYEGRQLCFKLRKTGGATLQWQRDDGKKGSVRIAG